MKIYCLIPSYNDCNYIKYTLDSIMEQTYKNFEIIIVDDGSTDDTKTVIEKYKESLPNKEKIIYVYQDNADQLNALKTASKYINDKNSLVYILHSDDILYDKYVFENAVKYMESNKCDAIISDIVTIDKDNNITGIQPVKDYVLKKYIPPLELLWLGRNLYTDTAFYRTNIFLESVYYNYLRWNGPFWLNLDSNDILNVRKVDFKFFKYRVFDENYINNSLGKLCVINGEIRVLTRLLNYYSIPFYYFQYFIYRFFNKIKMEKMFMPIYFNKTTKNKYKIIRFVLKKRFSDVEIRDNIFLYSLLCFYKKNSNRTVSFSNFNDEIIYEGSDLRMFNKCILNKTLSNFYLNFLNEMQLGFKTILVNSNKEKKNMEEILRFMSIYPYVEIKIKPTRGK